VRIAEADDVLISVRAPVGPTNLCPERSCIGRGLAAIRPLGGISSRYVLYALRSVESHIAQMGTGSTFAAIRGDVLRAFEIPLAPLAEQRRIVAAIEEHLSRLDAAVAGLKRVQAQLPRYRAAVLKAAVEGRLAPTGTARSEGNGLPTEWRWETVAALAERVDYGTSAKTAEAGDIPVLRMGNIRDGTLVLDSLRYLPANHREFPELLLQAGDILFNRTNSAELVGKSAGYRGHPYPCSFASYLIRVRLRPDCLPEFFAAVLNSVYGRRWIGEVVSQQVGQANVSGGKLKNFRIPLPPQNVQGHIVAEMERCFSLAVAVEGQVASGLMRARRLRQSVLRRALEGKLVPQDPNDEPGSVLLERIRTARADAPNKPGRARRAATR
jgi:type I restriction enzyme S subunit